MPFGESGPELQPRNPDDEKDLDFTGSLESRGERKEGDEDGTRERGRWDDVADMEDRDTRRQGQFGRPKDKE